MGNTFIGIETGKALENFPISGDGIDKELICAFGMVKLACCRTNHKLGYLPDHIAASIAYGCELMIDGNHHDMIVVDPYQGGAGTSYNMNFNETIAYLANTHINPDFDPDHDTWIVEPLNHVNMHQSTNDVFPTATRIAILSRLKQLESSISGLQDAFQKKEQEFSDVVKIGRTELQDAVPMTLGMEFGAYAEAISRDRWRIFKSRERIKTLNLGGTAIGTGLGAPREYIFKVIDELKRICGFSISRAENMIDYTQNLDSIAEVSAITKTLAVNLLKIANDLKLLSSGPDSGFQEIRLPDLQKGSTIMPGKVNPVIPEAVCQVAMKVINDDNLISLAAASGQLELNAYMPLIAHTLLKSLQLLTNTCTMFAEKCVTGIHANQAQCQMYFDQSKSIATYLVPILGYSRVESLVLEAIKSKQSIKDIVLGQKLLTSEQYEELMSPRSMYKLGFSESDYKLGD
ncbi:MAG: aspartate ammonia-lyase [Candidatus Cloacimonetes bacterium HGW-Cloacimonetes-1]|jgi:aspartate ammonia-lyase|nr:MAG: aspartate ammonia-lyase [Candidatus Cloacimonetes bacterium HGW-Cloacimonetes-1]